MQSARIFSFQLNETEVQHEPLARVSYFQLFLHYTKLNKKEHPHFVRLLIVDQFKKRIHNT